MPVAHAAEGVIDPEESAQRHRRGEDEQHPPGGRQFLPLDIAVRVAVPGQDEKQAEHQGEADEDCDLRHPAHCRGSRFRGLQRPVNSEPCGTRSEREACDST